VLRPQLHTSTTIARWPSADSTGPTVRAVPALVHGPSWGAAGRHVGALPIVGGGSCGSTPDWAAGSVATSVPQALSNSSAKIAQASLGMTGLVVTRATIRDSPN
jgi:hypothetical protein